MASGLYSGTSGLAISIGLYGGNSGLWGGTSGLINGSGTPAPIPTTLQSSATSADGTTTWVFDAPVEVGVFPNGEPFVIATPGRTIISRSPAAATDAAGTWLFNDPGANTTQAVTFQDAGDTVTRANHGLVNSQKVRFPVVLTTTGISANTDYVVLNRTTNTFQVATVALPAVPLVLTANGSGTMQRYGVSPRERNGDMVNPGNVASVYGGTGSTATNNGGAGFSQAFDSIDSTDAVGGSTIQDYSAGLRPAYPLAIDSPLSLVSAISNTTVVNLEGRQNIDRLNVLTVVSAAPVAGAFRPSPSATTKSEPALWSQVTTSFLPNLSKSGVTGAPADLVATTAQFTNLYQAYLTNNLFTRSIAPRLQQGGFSYGRDIAAMLGDALQLLCLDYNPAEKLALTIAITQIGLDFYERTEQGGKWPGGTTSAGGGCHHFQLFVVFAALALQNAPIGPALTVVAGGTAFATTRQLFSVTQNEIDIPRAIASVAPRPAPYQPYMKDTPDWTSLWPTVGVGGGASAGSQAIARYRGVVGTSSMGAFLAFSLMTGAATVLNKAEWFEYYYRYRYWIPTLELDATSPSAITSYFNSNFLPAYSAATPARTGVYGQGNWVWATFDKLLDVYNNPASGDFSVRVNGSGSNALTSTYMTTTTALVASGGYILPLTSITNIAVGQRVSGANIPGDTVIAAISGNNITLSRYTTGAVSSGATITFLPTVVYGKSVAIRLDTPLVEGDTFTMAYTSGATPARSVTSTNIASFTATAGVNQTSALPPPATTKEMVANDNASGVLGHVATAAAVPAPPGSPFDRLLVGIRLEPTVTPVNNQTLLSDLSPAGAELRFYTVTGTTRTLFLNGSIRPVNAWTGRGAGVQSTHWFLIDTSAAFSASSYRYAIDGIPISQTGSTQWTGGLARTFTMADLFPGGIAVLGAQAGGADLAQMGIQEMFIHAASTALPNPEADPVTFGNSFDWGGNGENILGSAPLFYWAFDASDMNTGTTINRGTTGQTAALYNTPDIDLEIYQPYRVV